MSFNGRNELTVSKNQSGFLGGLDPQMTTGRFAPYYADHSVEVIFHVPTMMPNNPSDEQQIHKKRHVGNDHVTIVWSEHAYAYRPNTITSQFNHVHIVITPLKCGLYHVRIDFATYFMVNLMLHRWLCIRKRAFPFPFSDP